MSHSGMSADAIVEREVDLLIAGAGPAGMAAALVASLEGLDVILCEKSDQVGGTGSTSAGTLWIPGNSQSSSSLAESIRTTAAICRGLRSPVAPSCRSRSMDVCSAKIFGASVRQFRNLWSSVA